MLLPRRDPAMIPGTVSAQFPNEAPGAASSAGDAVCLYEYEICNKTPTSRVVAVTRPVDHLRGTGLGDVGWHV